MRFIFLSLSFYVSLNASYLLNLNNSNYFCIDDYYYSNNQLIYLKSQDQNTYSSTQEHYIRTGYDYNNSKCTLKPILKESGLSYEDFNYILALLGALVGFTFIFLSSYLVIEISYKRR